MQPDAIRCNQIQSNENHQFCVYTFLQLQEYANSMSTFRSFSAEDSFPGTNLGNRWFPCIITKKSRKHGTASLTCTIVIDWTEDSESARATSVPQWISNNSYSALRRGPCSRMHTHACIRSVWSRRRYVSHTRRETYALRMATV